MTIDSGVVVIPFLATDYGLQAIGHQPSLLILSSL